jgi:hypothetical protein
MIINHIIWINDVNEDAARLTYRQFRMIYAVMPERFSLCEACVFYDSELVEFKNFRSVLAYRLFFKEKAKYDNQMFQMNNQARLIREIQNGYLKNKECKLMQKRLIPQFPH